MKRNGLFFVAAFGLALVLVLIILLSSRRAAVLTESAETRRTVEDALDTWMPPAAESAEDAKVLDAARSVANAPYVARLWIVDDTGKILFHHDGPGQEGDTVRTLAGRDGRSLVGGLSSEEFSGPQALQIYTAAALMVEGEHNDVFRPLVRPIKNAAGRVVGMIGISYDVSEEVSAPPASEIILSLLLLLGLGLFWLPLPLWTYLDARSRQEPALLWAAFVLVANLVGVVAYLLIVNHRKVGTGMTAR